MYSKENYCPPVAEAVALQPAGMLNNSLSDGGSVSNPTSFDGYGFQIF